MKFRKYKQRFYHDWWIYRRVMWVYYNKLGEPHFDNMRWEKGQWEIVYKIASFEFTIRRDYHEPGCLCDRGACEEVRKYA
jgi:hypothetical protein